MNRRSLRDWAQRERAVLALVALASTAAFAAWGGTTRPMEDTVDYRAAAAVLRAGWHQMPDRGPGYALILLATGAGRSDNALLFLVQLGAHAMAVLLVVDLARRVGVGPRGRLVLAILLMMPVVLMKAVYVGSEVWAELALALIAWLFVRWDEQRRLPLLVAIGIVVGIVTTIRPTYQLLVVPLAVAVACLARRDHAARAVAALTVPAALLIGSLVVANAIRFDSPEVDRLLPYHLSEKTAMFVEDLPPSEEPARSILVRRRNQLLVDDAEHSPAAFAFDSRTRLAAATGKSGPALDREVLRLDLLLIWHHPLSYLSSVEQASLNYLQLDAQEAGYGGWAPLSWLWSLVHLALAAVFLGVSLVVPGVMLVRGADRRFLVVTGICWMLVLYNAAVTVTIVMGEARIRTPTDPLLALLLVSGLWWLKDAVPVGRLTGTRS